MSTRYEVLPEPRFTVKIVDGVEQIRIKARKQIFTLLFLSFWLVMWTIGGVTAAYQFVETHELFLAAWLCAWAAAWIFVTATIGWTLTGAETLRVTGGDLEIAYHLFTWSRRRLYRGDQIRNLRADQVPWMVRMQPEFPLLRKWKGGAVCFDYGARTIHAAPGLDAAEGAMIVGRLLKRLPASAR